MGLLKQHDYMVSYKADGTRYLMYITERNTFLVGRDNAICMYASTPTDTISAVVDRYRVQHY